jgi:hypothetical protein
MPVPKRGTSSASMSCSDSTGAVCASDWCWACEKRLAPAVSITVSTIVFHCWQDEHWPVHLLLMPPHSLQV